MGLFLFFLLVAAIGLVVLMVGRSSENDKATLWGFAVLVIGLGVAFAVAFVELRDGLNKLLN